MTGRVQIDLLSSISEQHKLRSYTLKDVAVHFLEETREELSEGDICAMWDGSDKDRSRLISQCQRDAELSQMLMERLHIFTNSAEMAKVCGIPMKVLFSSGQQAKVISQLYSWTSRHGFIIPVKGSGTSDEKYEGGTVLEPAIGLHSETSIAVLDFQSLYPSIIIAHNLCYTTKITKEQASKMREEDYTKTPTNAYFVRSHIRKGILPSILENLLAERMRAKKDLEAATEPLERAVHDGRQLALKVSANSVYGFTGIQNGKLPSLDIAKAVTAFGREMLAHAKSAIECADWVLGAARKPKVVYGGSSITEPF